MRLLAPSYTAFDPYRASGPVPVGVSWLQAGGPVSPLALVSSQTSFNGAQFAAPPNMIARSFALSDTKV
jgi:hypothetical protein